MKKLILAFATVAFIGFGGTAVSAQTIPDPLPGSPARAQSLHTRHAAAHSASCYETAPQTSSVSLMVPQPTRAAEAAPAQPFPHLEPSGIDEADRKLKRMVDLVRGTPLDGQVAAVVNLLARRAGRDLSSGAAGAHFYDEADPGVGSFPARARAAR